MLYFVAICIVDHKINGKRKVTVYSATRNSPRAAGPLFTARCKVHSAFVVGRERSGAFSQCRHISIKASNMLGVKLERNAVLRNRWRVIKKLAEGGFGAVYEAMDTDTKKKVAIKIESTKQSNPVLKVETAVLLLLRGKSNRVCGIVGAGVERSYNFVVMSLVGRSLSDLQKSVPDHKFSESTTVRLGLGCLKGIDDLHSVGFVHRDIKPGNFAIGRKSSDCRLVYLLDFGLARAFRLGSGKQSDTRPPRSNCGFRGTVRYASTNAHDGSEIGRHDDIWSLFYILIEFQKGQLPWHAVAQDSEVARMKRRITVEELISGMAEEFKAIHDTLKKLRYDQKPNYEWFREQFKAIQKRKELPKIGAFEWEEDE